MKKALSVILIFWSLGSSLCAQTDSLPIGMIIYNQNVDGQVQGDIENNGTSVLLFNRAASLYIYKSAPTIDSSYSTAEYVSVNIKGDKEGFPILKLHNEHKLYFKIPCRQARNHCIVSDTFGAIAWTMQPEHRRFGQFDCRRATGEFRGREYEAWYTLDIPIPTGPFKLGGLPGLILEARSLDGKVSFMFSGIEVSRKIPGAIIMPTGKDIGMTYAQYIQDLDIFDKKMIKEAKAEGFDVFITPLEAIELNTGN